MIRRGFLVFTLLSASLVSQTTPAHAGSLQVRNTTPEVVYQSPILERATGDPAVYRATFDACDPDAPFRLIFENGVESGPRVSSGSVLLNGATIVLEHDLSQQVARVSRPVSLQATNTLEIRLAGAPGGRARVTVEGHPNCLRIRITAPPPHSVFREPSVLLEGEVTPRGAVGVRVRATLTLRGVPVDVGGPAFVSGGRLAAVVDLAPGPVVLTVVATDAMGRTVEDSVMGIFEPSHPEYTRPWRPDVSPTVGFAPLTVTFGSPGIVGPDVDLLELDVEGDGTPDYRLADFAASAGGIPYTYQREGLYLARMVMRETTSGVSATAWIPIYVIPRPDVVAIWNGLRAALARGDVEAAARFVSDEARERYRRAFEDLRADLAAVAADLEDATELVVNPDYATAGTTRTRDGRVEGFLIHFIRDVDGVWRIASM